MKSSEKWSSEGRNQGSIKSGRNNQPGTNPEYSPAASAEIFDRIIHGSSECMKEIPDESVALTVTSPPYNVNKEYEPGQTFEHWQGLMRRVFTEVRRVTVPGGRVCVNVAGTGRSPYLPLQYYATGILLDLGFLMRGEIIWDKGASVGTSTAWGSWCSASNPCLRDVHEHILVFSKGSPRRDKTGDDTIDRDEFLEYTKSIWKFSTVSAQKIGHPSPFPLELPRRLIQLYSFSGDLILDPFCGSGTTCVAAVLSGRRYIGYDIIESYCQLARERVTQAMDSISPGNDRHPR